MVPYKKYSDGRIEADGYLFDNDNEFGNYCDYQERCDEYWKHQEEIEKENRLLELEDEFGLRFK